MLDFLKAFFLALLAAPEEADQSFGEDEGGVLIHPGG